MNGFAAARSANVVTSDVIERSATALIDTWNHGSIAAVILIHMGCSQKAQWKSLPFLGAVADAGTFAFAFDLRGHAKSGGVKEVSTLFDDPNQSPRGI